MKIKRIPKKGLPGNLHGYYVLFSYSERKLSTAKVVFMFPTLNDTVASGYTHYARVPAYFSP